MTMMKKLMVRSPHGRPHQHGLAMEDSLGVTFAWAELDRQAVANLIEQINAAVDRGAPWQKYEPAPRRY